MEDKIYESCQYLAYGLLVGYFGLYALDWFKSWKEQVKNDQKTETKPKEQVINHV